MTCLKVWKLTRFVTEQDLAHVYMGFIQGKGIAEMENGFQHKMTSIARWPMAVRCRESWSQN